MTGKTGGIRIAVPILLLLAAAGPLWALDCSNSGGQAAAQLGRYAWADWCTACGGQVVTGPQCTPGPHWGGGSSSSTSSAAQLRQQRADAAERAAVARAEERRRRHEAQYVRLVSGLKSNDEPAAAPPSMASAPPPAVVAAPGAAPATQSPSRAPVQQGMHDAGECMSSHAATFCLNTVDPAACAASYAQGYNSGAMARDAKLQNAETQGATDKRDGRPMQARAAFNDPAAVGACRIDWINAYSRGYAAAKRGNP